MHRFFVALLVLLLSVGSVSGTVDMDGLDLSEMVVDFGRTDCMV